ncbi:MAG: Holliday junction branch migration protein RuvA [Deltaproteobacteria bacterium]|nr:Holliday junction branch migration protein RuvA [Deltaproteobacteria bacterium]
MIAHIRGRLIHKSPDSVIVDINGVGYEVLIPLSTFYKLPEMNETVSLKVHTNMREDSIQLFGFLTQDEKDAFQLLISVSGVGPRLARNILSGIAVPDLVAAIGTSDKGRLSLIPGIGGKSAERLIVELKDKVKRLPASGTKKTEEAPKDSLSADVVSALDNLGYKNVQSEEAVKKARANMSQGHAFEDLFKESLKFLSKK